MPIGTSLQLLEYQMISKRQRIYHDITCII